jgi:hypothetical protein
VVNCYQNSTLNAFKTQLRLNGGAQYWYYNITSLEGVLETWDISFRCANATEETTLYLEFYNSNSNLISKLKFMYLKEGLNPPVDYLIKLYYWSPLTASWKQLYNGMQDYLYNGWYRIKIDVVNEFYLKYSLYKKDIGLVNSREDLSMDPLFIQYIPGSTDSNLVYIKFYTMENPMICPMIIWDDHRIELRH